MPGYSMEKLSVVLSVLVICCVLRNTTTAKPAATSFVEFTMYETKNASYVEELGDPSDLEYFRTLEKDSQGNYKLPIFRYAYVIRHPPNTHDREREPIRNQQQIAPPASAQIISEVQKLLSSKKNITEKKHSEDASAPAQDGSEFVRANESQDGSAGDLGFYISVPQAFAKCRNSNRRKNCSPKRMPPKEKDRKKLSI